VKDERILERLKQSDHYRGQVFRHTTSESTSGSGTSSYSNDVINEMLALLGMSGLYLHQADALKALEKGNNCCLFSEQGGGKALAVNFAAMNALISDGRAILILSKSDRIQARTEEIKTFLNTVKWNSQILPLAAEDVPGLRTQLGKKPDILVSSPEAVLSLLQSSDLSDELEFFLGCGMTVIENFDSYIAGQILHLKYLLKTLFTITQGQMQAFVTCIPVKSMEQFAQTFLGDARQNTVVKSMDVDYPVDIAYWVPPLLMDSDGVFKRVSVMQELGRIIPDISSAGVQKILIWLASERYDHEALSVWQESLDPATSDFKIDIDWITDIGEVEDGRSSYQAAIIIGYPVGMGKIKNLAGNLISLGGVLLIMPDEDPLSYAAFRDEPVLRFAKNITNVSEVETQECFIPSNAKIKHQYTLLSLGCVGSGFRNLIPVELFLKIWGANQYHRNSELDELNEEGLLVFDAEEKNAKLAPDSARWLKLRTVDIAWGAMESERFYVENYGFLDASLVVHKAFNSALIHDKGLKFQFTHHHDNHISLDAATTSANLGTIPIRKTLIEGALTELAALQTEDSELTVKMLNISNLTVTTDSYYAYTSYSDLGAGQIYALSPLLEHKTDNIRALKLECEDTHAFFHFWQLYFVRLIRDIGEYVFWYREKDAIWVCAISPERNEFIEYLFSHFRDLYSHIQGLALNVLLAHPSAEPTPQCLKTNLCLDCRQTPLGITGKEALIRTLAAGNTQKTLAERIFRFKKEVPEPEIRLHLTMRWAEVIPKLFKTKLEMTINNLADVHIDGDRFTNTNVVGLYALGGNQIYITDKLTEAFCVQILAHELAHNWQFTGNIHSSMLSEELPANGLIVIEGFAEWVSYKICDLLGLHEQMKGIDLLKIDGGRYIQPDGSSAQVSQNEYSVGFQFIHWIETTVTGAFGLIELMKTGSTPTWLKTEPQNILKLLQRFSQSRKAGMT